MNAEQIIEFIRTAEKKTPVKVYLWEKAPTSFPGAKEFPAGPGAKIVFGDWKTVGPQLEAQQEAILDMVVETRPGIPPCPSWISGTSAPALSREPLSGIRWRSETAPSS